MTSSYQPIESYGIIGNMRTAALVGMDGSIDWLCLPHFDSPSVFAALLDAQKGGRFRIAPSGDDFRNKQFYWPDTNVLITRFLHADGIGEIEDYMPVGAVGASPDQLVRRVRVVRGKVSFHLECSPAFDYARAPPEIHLGEHGARFEGPDLTLGLASSVPLASDNRRCSRRFHARRGRKRYVRLAPSGCRGCADAVVPASGRRRICFAPPSISGGDGFPSALIRAAGARSCSVPR